MFAFYVHTFHFCQRIMATDFSKLISTKTTAIILCPQNANMSPYDEPSVLVASCYQ